MVYLLIALIVLLITTYSLQRTAAQRRSLGAAFATTLALGSLTGGPAIATEDDSQNSDTRLLHFTEQGVSIRLIGDSHYQVGSAGEDGAYSRALPLSRQIKLRSRTFDPIKSAPDVQIPARLMSAQEDMDEEDVYIVQCTFQPLESFQNEITALGGSIHAPLAENALLVRLSPAARQLVEALPFVRWVGPYHPAYKLQDELYELLARGDAGQAAQTSGRPQRYSILLFERSDAALAAVTERISQLGGVVDMVGDSRRMEATLDETALEEISRMAEILYIDLWTPYEDDMDQVREIVGANYLESIEGYRGQGVNGEVSDDGVRLTHVDFRNNPPLLHGRNDNDNNHGTNTYGIVFGDGTGNAKGLGMLPEANPIFSSRYGMSNRARHTEELVDPDGPYRAVFQSNSWGSSRTTGYTSISAEMDEILFDTDLLVTQSQSNEGTRMSRPQAWAKNIVAVGGIRGYDTERRSDDRWASGASIGPASDGRIKPDLSNFYGNLFCPNEDGDRKYTFSFGGTSGATPITAGQFGLFFQMWADGIFAGGPGLGRDVFNSRPHMSTAKALVINTAYQYAFSGTNHDRTRTHQGWGFPDLKNIHEMAQNNNFSVPILIDETQVLRPLDTHSYTLEMAGDTPLKATMVYADPAGLPSAAQARINDLSLRVTSPSGTVYWGNNGLKSGNWSTPGGSPNDVDTVENVFVQLAEAGVWTVEVLGDEIVQDSHRETAAMDADYALVVTRGLQPPPTGTPNPSVSVAATVSSVAEEGPGNGEFTITRSGDTTLPLTVTYQVGGTATPDTDYVALSSEVTIASGQSSTTINVSPIDDTDPDTGETVILVLSTGTEYQVVNPGTATVTITDAEVEPQPGPDLAVGVMSITDNTVVPGASLGYNLTIFNQGNQSAQANFARLVLSADAVIDDSDLRLSNPSLPVSALAAGASVALTGQVAIPANVASGGYYLGVIVDPSGIVTERDESNNTRAVAITVTERPDLTVSALSVTGDPVAPGASLGYDLTVLNQGNQNAQANYVRLVLSTDAVIDGNDLRLTKPSLQLSSLAASVSAVLTGQVAIPANVAPGGYYLGVIVDPSGIVAEHDESNNTRAVAITVTGATPDGPDLVASTLSLTGSPVVPGASLGYNLEVLNQGNLSAQANYARLVLSTDAVIDGNDLRLTIPSLQVSALAAGASLVLTGQVTIPASVAPEGYYLGVIVDPSGIVAERDESNNTRSVAFMVTNGPGTQRVVQ